LLAAMCVGVAMREESGQTVAAGVATPVQRT